jgi:hypothetical protein
VIERKRVRVKAEARSVRDRLRLDPAIRDRVDRSRRAVLSAREVRRVREPREEEPDRLGKRRVGVGGVVRREFLEPGPAA